MATLTGHSSFVFESWRRLKVVPFFLREAEYFLCASELHKAVQSEQAKVRVVLLGRRVETI